MLEPRQIRGIVATTFQIADFREDLRLALLEHLAAFGYPVPEGMDADGVLVFFLNLARRRISQRPRTVHESSALTARTLDPARGEVLSALREASTRGADLNPYLHKLLRRKPEYDDGLLNDFGLHHFHLGSAQPEPGKEFTARSDELLFALVRNDDLYLVDVRDHSSFDDEDFIEIMHNNWPEVIARWRMKGITMRPEQELTREQRRTVRKKGINAAVRVSDGTVYASPGGGQATSGLSISVRVEADRALDAIDQLRRDAAASQGAIIGALPKADRYEIHLRPTFDGFSPSKLMLVDAVTGIGIDPS